MQHLKFIINILFRGYSVITIGQSFQRIEKTQWENFYVKEGERISLIRSNKINGLQMFILLKYTHRLYDDIFHATDELWSSNGRTMS